MFGRLVGHLLTLNYYTFFFWSMPKTAIGCGFFSLCWRPLGGLRLFWADWSGCCLYYIFLITVRNSILDSKNEFIEIKEILSYFILICFNFFLKSISCTIFSDYFCKKTKYGIVEIYLTIQSIIKWTQQSTLYNKMS